ncbi:class IV adenylate cyclase [Acidianus sulfidivorans JP7]|uniref:Class IV adenylate cyclase n=1 Tax=Acidianus sulfidivorans JP7 TaxID=619593 RepID=A0A2U9IMR1_9CREN|nr:class IV adenylate cyclase [Acidianus sulfidivorans]AWR97224.1 class IV adenylate cyclase [Acidianus sulfidivorans JP7]
MSDIIEREIKLKLENKNLDELYNELKENGIKFIGEEKEIDIYFNSIYRDFKKTDEALRIRHYNNSDFELTYKSPKIGTITKSREEITVKIPIEQEDNLIKILQKLGFNPVYKVIKNRKYFRDNNFIICLDNVENLGNFIEIELDNGPENELVEYVNKFLAKFNIKANKINKSYLELLVDKNE